MEEQLKKIIGLNGWYLDIHSVKDGFRDVCLVGLIGEDSGRQLEFNLRGVSSLPSMMEQAVFVGEYVERNMPQHKIIPAWAHLFFIADDSKVDDVEHLLSDYSRPVRFKNGERRLGLLLGYSECCVKAHLEDRLPYRDYSTYPIPFSPCSTECEKPWMNEYLRLARKYGVNISREFV